MATQEIVNKNIKKEKNKGAFKIVIVIFILIAFSIIKYFNKKDDNASENNQTQVTITTNE